MSQSLHGQPNIVKTIDISRSQRAAVAALQAEAARDIAESERARAAVYATGYQAVVDELERAGAIKAQHVGKVHAPTAHAEPKRLRDMNEAEVKAHVAKIGAPAYAKQLREEMRGASIVPVATSVESRQPSGAIPLQTVEH